MEQLYIFLGVTIPCIVVGYLYSAFMGSLYITIYSDKVYKVIYTFFVLIWIGISLCRIPFLTSVFGFIALIIMSYKLYDSRGKPVLLNSIIYMLYCVFADTITIPIYAMYKGKDISDVMNSPAVFFITGILSALLLICTFKLVITFFLKQKIKNISSVQNIFMVFLLVFEYGLMYYMFLYIQTKWIVNVLIIMVSGFFVIDIFLVHLFETITVKNELANHAALMNQQKQIIHRYYENLETKYHETRKIIHDAKKHIQILENMYQFSTDYGQAVNEVFDGFGYQYKCSHKILNIILNDMILVCSNKSIGLNLPVQDIDFSFVEDIDITVIFVNLIDNAIEACEELDDASRYIHVIFSEMSGYITISIVNACNDRVEADIRDEVSSKADHMGIGLSNVESVVEKYGGDIKCEVDRGEFIVKILLPT